MEKELRILEALNDDPVITQRGISKKSGLSVGTVNLVLERLIRDGMVKIERIPSHRIAYILTPEGIREKISKTRAYLQIYYELYDRERDRIKRLISQQHHGERLEITVKDPILLRLTIQVVEELSLTSVSDNPLYVADGQSAAELEGKGLKIIRID